MACFLIKSLRIEFILSSTNKNKYNDFTLPESCCKKFIKI